MSQMSNPKIKPGKQVLAVVIKELIVLLMRSSSNNKKTMIW